MATFPDSISLSKIQHRLSRRTLIKSASQLSAAAAMLAAVPSLTSTAAREEIQRVVHALERLGRSVLLYPFRGEQWVFIGNPNGTGCISNALFERFHACNYDAVADYLRDTGRVQPA